jgi:hypothetical protein
MLSSVYSEYGVTLDVSDVNSAITARDLWRVVEGARGA